MHVINTFMKCGNRYAFNVYLLLGLTPIVQWSKAWFTPFVISTHWLRTVVWTARNLVSCCIFSTCNFCSILCSILPFFAFFSSCGQICTTFLRELLTCVITRAIFWVCATFDWNYMQRDTCKSNFLPLTTLSLSKIISSIKRY